MLIYNTINDYDIDSFKNLLMRYSSNKNGTGKEEIILFLESAEKFENGKIRQNNFIPPSDAYQYVMKTLHVMEKKATIDEIKNALKDSEPLASEFIETLIKLIEVSYNQDKRSVSNLISWV